jgi:hypothetical protein
VELKRQCLTYLDRLKAAGDLSSFMKEVGKAKIRTGRSWPTSGDGNKSDAPPYLLIWDKLKTTVACHGEQLHICGPRRRVLCH